MACPVASTLSLGAACGGVYTLFVQDQRRRLVSLSILLALVAGWTVYFVWARTPGVRLALDVVSTAAVLAGVWRLYRLVRFEGVVPPFSRAIARLLKVLSPVVHNPWVLSLKVWLLFMVVTEWRGLAQFSGLEYTMVSVLLVTAIGVQLWRAKRAAPTSAFPDLAGYTQPNGAVQCPLGFGCEHRADESRGPETTPPATARKQL